MTLFSSIKALFTPSRKTVDVAALLDLAESSVHMTSYHGRVRRGYKENGVVYGAVNLIARTLGGLPWILLRRLGDEEEELSAHPALKLFERPSASMGRSQFLQQFVIHLYLGGKACIARVDSSDGRPLELLNLRPDLVEEAKDGTVALKNSSGQVVTRYPAEEVLKLRLLDPEDDLAGLSPVEVAALTIAQSNYAREWNRNLLASGARPTGVLTAKGGIEFPDEEVNRILERFTARFGGFKQAGRPVFVQGDFSWDRLSLTPAEMDWLKGELVADRMTSFTFGVPSQLLGDTESSTFQNVRTAREFLYTEVVLPLAWWLRDELNRWLLPRYQDGENLRFDVNTDKIDALQEDRAQQWQRVSAARWLTVDERREAAGYGRLEGEGGDVLTLENGISVIGGRLFVPATLVPLGFAEEDGDTASVVTGLEIDGKQVTKTEVQSLLLSRDRFTLAEARAWVLAHGFRADKVDRPPTGNTWRFRQFDPGRCQAGSFRTIDFRGVAGVQAVVCRPKKLCEVCEEPRESEEDAPPAINLPDARAKGVYWKVFDRAREPYVRVARFHFGRVFAREAKAVLKALRESGPGETGGAAIESAISQVEPYWQRAYERVYLLVGEAFARRVLRSIVGRRSVEVGDWAGLSDYSVAAAAIDDWKQDEEVFDPFAEAIRRYLGTESGKKIQGISKRSLSLVRDELARGVEAGEGIDQLAERIDAYLRPIYAHRAETVARTEVINASNAASDFAAQSTGVVSEKEWIATRDDRVRDTHAGADGQKVGAEEPFSVGGARLLWPGDTSLGAPAGEVVNCRCAVGYVT